MPDEQPVHQVGRRVVEAAVRDPVVGSFLHGEVVPALAGSVEDTMVALLPVVVRATIDRAVGVSCSGEFPVHASPRDFVCVGGT